MRRAELPEQHPPLLTSLEYGRRISVQLLVAKPSFSGTFSENVFVSRFAREQMRRTDAASSWACADSRKCLAAPRGLWRRSIDLRSFGAEQSPPCSTFRGPLADAATGSERSGGPIGHAPPFARARSQAISAAILQKRRPQMKRG